jgi:hypothetical protein
VGAAADLLPAIPEVGGIDTTLREGIPLGGGSQLEYDPGAEPRTPSASNLVLRRLVERLHRPVGIAGLRLPRSA